MNITEKMLATKICTEILQSRKQGNLDSRVWASENLVIDRLITRALELQKTYVELYRGLHLYPDALEKFFEVLLDAVILRAPAKIAKARNERDDLIRLNQKIAELSTDLAHLMRRRDELHNTSVFRSNTSYHIADILTEAGQRSNLFTMFLEPDLKKLQAHHDLKYWPSLDAFVDAIAEDASNADVEASDPITKAAIEATRASRTDFFKAWFEKLDEHRVDKGGIIPDNFRLTDTNLASIANCALDLTEDDLIDGLYVKRLRQRLRDSKHREETS